MKKCACTRSTAPLNYERKNQAIGGGRNDSEVI